MRKNDFRIVNELMDIGIAISSEKDSIAILERILSEARKITNSDAGTIYLIKGGELKFTASQNDTLKINSINDISLDWPSVKITDESASGYVGTTGEILNIDDVYHNNDFDFSEPKKYDELSGYRTKSMLVLPLANHDDELIGVLQLINAKNEKGEIISFDKNIHKVLISLASQAAISITKTKLIQDIETVFNGFVSVMVTSLDAQTSYNANHTKNMIRMAELFIEYLNDLYNRNKEGMYWDKKGKHRLLTAIWLHDIGKIGIPATIMNKPTRLGEKKDVEIIINRIEFIKQKLHVTHLESKILSLKNKENNYIETEMWLKRQYEILENYKAVILSANEQSVIIDDDMKNELREISQSIFKGYKGRILTNEELENLTIEKGTLLPAERKKIQDHILYTNNMLSKIDFQSYLSEVPSIVSKHHEFLDGSGYPFGIKGDEIPLDTRIITILDIHESLTARDRPYRKAFTIEEAYEMLKKMADEGKIDGRILSLFIDSNTAFAFHKEYIEKDKHSYDCTNCLEMHL